jgi:hypothetical protein
VSLFKTFIAQYQSSYSTGPQKGVPITQIGGLQNNLSKLDLNNISVANPSILSQRGQTNQTLITDEAKLGSSQAKTFDVQNRNSSQLSHSVVGNQSIREFKVEPLRRKFANNLISQSKTRRIGDELRRIGQQMSELPKVKEE